MAKRIKVGLIYSYDEGWIAGSYYILNLIHSLNLIDDSAKPELTILAFSEDEFQHVRISTQYPYLKFHKLYQDDIWGSNYYFHERIINKIARIFVHKNLINRAETVKRLNAKVDFVFPMEDHIYFSNVKNKIYWIPDFQEHFLPQLFSEDLISRRKKYQKKLSLSDQPIVFSSFDAQEQFNLIYPDAMSKTFVLQFAVTHSAYDDLDIISLKEKYKIQGTYFFSPNQFWAHKNHLTLLKAVKYLRDKGRSEILVVFSGKEVDPRNPNYFEGLRTYVIENKIENQIRFLGFIDRTDQLQLMNYSRCVIQPSKFEGWSTTVEDAKSMNQFVIVSDIKVHKEQLTQNAAFFSPDDHVKLAEIMEKYYDQSPDKIKIDYKINRKNFGKSFIDILEKI